MAAAYLTLSDLVARVGEAQVLRVLDGDNDGAADADAVDAVLTDAERFVQGHVGRVYPMAAILANAVTLAGIRALAIPVAVHYAFQRRTEFTTREGSIYQGAYSEAVKTLKDIGAGKYRLDDDGAPAIPANSGGGPRYGTIDNISPQRPFARNGTGLF